MNPLSTGTMNPEVPLGVTTSTQNPLNPDGSESEADLGLRGAYFVSLSLSLSLYVCVFVCLIRDNVRNNYLHPT